LLLPVHHLDALLVSVSTSYSIDMVKGEEQQLEENQEVAGALTGPLRAVMPNTPVATANAWSADVGVF
jgi:hypothetical protein